MSASTRCAQSAPKGGIVNSCGESVWCAGCALVLRVRAARGVCGAPAPRPWGAIGVLLGGGCGAASRGGHRSDRPRRASCGAVGAG